MSDEKSPDDDKSRLISLAEAAELYGFSPNYLGNLVRRGRLKAQKIGNSWATTPNDVEDFIRNRKERGIYRDDISLDN
jgi:hypothetical protein